MRSPSAKQVLLHWIPVLVWAGLIFYLSSQPARAFPRLPAGSDKVLHAIVFGILAVLIQRALRHGGPRLMPTTALIWSIVGATLYGISDEIHQALEPSGTRHPSVGDVAADAIGAMLASGVYFLLARTAGKRVGER